MVFAGADLSQRLEAYCAGDELLDVVELGCKAIALRDDPFFILLGQGERGVVVHDGDRGDLCRVEVGDNCFADAGFFGCLAALILDRGEVGDAAQHPQGEHGDEKLFSFHWF